MRVLSTKILSPSQKELLLNSGLSFVEYNALNVQFLEFEMPPKVENAIFTSQYAIDAVFSKNHEKKPLFQNCFCVGEKSKMKIEQNGQKVAKSAENGQELGEYLSKTYKNEPFFYFCGIDHRPELPKLLKSSENELFRVKTYKTTPNLKEFDQKWDGILFFSPKGVQSYLKLNSLGESLAICIGETTVSEIKKHTNHFVMANSTTVESVIAKAVKSLLHVQN